MRLRGLASALLPLLSLTAWAAQSGSSPVLPGVTYYTLPEKLSGTLVFLLTKNGAESNNTERAASIYELDLTLGTLRKVTDAPSGTLFASADGGAFCVICWLGRWENSNSTNAFIYSTSPRQSRVLNLSNSPAATVLVDGHAFFQLETRDDIRNMASTALWDYDSRLDRLRLVELTNASRWQYQTYDKIAAPTSKPSLLHFCYSTAGQRIENGRDYETGIYSIDLQTGAIQWVSRFPGGLGGPKASTFNGRHVFFEGSEAPIEGFRLVSSPWNDYWTKEKDPEGKQTKLLHSFSKLAALNGGSYVLMGVSPCGQYVLVRFMEPIARKTGLRQGWVNTYYLVDIANGKTQVLLKDEVQRKTSNSMSPVLWIRGSP